MRISDFVKESVVSLNALYPEREARSIVLILCEALLGVKSYTYVIDPGMVVPDAMEATLKEAMARLCKGEPVQYVVGKTIFYGREFKVSPAVLIPRPETELLCSEAIRLARTKIGAGKEKVRILDLCTGSGCIAWTMALEVPAADVMAVDISGEALRLASSQTFPGENGRVAFIRADVLDAVHFPDLGKFDIVLSNPPYIMDSERKDMRRNVLDYEPPIALFVPDSDPLVFYRAIAKIARKTGAEGIVEINERLAGRTEDVFRGEGYVKLQTIKDINDRNRIVRFS